MSSVVNDLIAGLKGGVLKVVEMLPASPFVFPAADSAFLKFLGYANYFLPISEIITVLQAWCLAIIVWYGAMIFLRWIQAIE